MSERTRDTELSVVEGLWWTLDDQQLIKDVVMKGKYISNAIKFIANRNHISVEEAKDLFFNEVSQFVNSLIRNKQLHRAIHVLKNVQLNEFYYLYDFYQEEEDEAIKELIIERLNHLDPEMADKEKVLKANHLFFKLLASNINKHSKYLESTNRQNSVSAITPSNISKIIFGTFMKQPVAWRNELATDVFFKSKNVHLRHVLDRHCFFAYIIRNEFYAILKQWLQEAYWCRAGNMIQSTLPEPETFEAGLLSLFREWKFEQKMMDLIARREKDVVKNDFAKLGLFENREAKFICRKLNRFFTTHTFHDNFPHLKTDQVTKFVIENSLMDLLSEKFIDFHYIQLLLDNLDVIYMRDELVLVERIRNLMSPETDLDEFLEMITVTSDYICEFDKNFNRNRPDLKLIDLTLRGLPANDFQQMSDINSFTQNLMSKLRSQDETLPTIEELLENYHSISLNFIRDEFEKSDDGELNISFNDKIMSGTYADVLRLNFVNYVQQYQSAFGSYLLIRDIIQNSMTVSRSQVLIGCEEVAKLAVQNPENRELVSHVMTMLEIFSVDSRNLRCFLRLMKLKTTADDQGFESQLNALIKVGSDESDLCNVEALEVFWAIRNVKDPPRSYLNPYIASNDWFRMVLLAQYLNFSLKSFVSICDTRIDDKALRDNLTRAILFDSSPDLKKRCSFSKKRRLRSSKNEESCLFPKGKFLDIKRDLFSILLKCDENLERFQMKFEDFQKMMLKKEESNDLLHHAKMLDWPLISVLAATTKLYRWKFCWITWLILSSDYKWNEKFETIEELSQRVIEHCVEKGFIRTLDESMKVFYPQSALKVLSSFFWRSRKGDVEEMESILKQLIVKLSEQNYQMVAVKGKEESLNFIVRCIIKNLQLNFQSILLQEKYLEALCRSEISQFSGKVDFALMKRICKILERTNHRVDYEMISCQDRKSMIGSIGKMCESLIEDHQFEAAIEVSDLMSLPKADFVYKWWMHMWKCEDRENKNFETKKYMKYVTKYHLNIDVMIKFLLTVIKDLETCVKKFHMMRFVLRNSWIENQAELDMLEYETILLYVKLMVEGEATDLKPLMSEYFESVISKEKCIIHNSLYELKSTAKIDELTVSHKVLHDTNQLEKLDELIHNLLDAGDVVQVLRIQEMFGRAPEDLKLLVYIMSIAEGINSIYDITKEERKVISSYGLMSNKFNRLTLRSIRTSSSTSMSSSPSHDLSESIILDDSTSRSTYKENKETFLALQGLACKMKHGAVGAQRIALIYRASLFLNRNFVDLIKVKDSSELLELAAATDCENKLMVMNDIMVACQMSNIEIAEFIAKEIVACIIRTRFLQFNKETELVIGSTSSWSPTRESMDDIWGFSLLKDLHLILELCTSSFLLGNYLLKYFEVLSQETVDIPLHSDDPELEKICLPLNKLLTPQMMSLKKQNATRVELLITAHECFCHECSTEGIGSILNLCKSFCNHLAAKKNFSLIVKLLCGIGRYREMFYCFDILIKNEQFEALLGQFSDKQTNSLKMAILSYLNEYHPSNKEYYKMAASHFMMYTELANIWRNNSLEKIQLILTGNQVKVMKTGKINSNQQQQVEIPYLKCSKILISGLNDVLTGMIHATEMVLVDNKIDMSIKFSSFCELIAVQIHLIKVGVENEEKLCPCIINNEQNGDKFQYFANYELTVPQTMILMKNTDVKIDLSKAIFVHLLLEDEGYMLDFMARLEMTDEMIESVVKIAQLDNISVKQEKILSDLVMMVSDKGLKFRLASLLGLKSQLQQMLNDQGTYYYLLDSKYGTLDIL